MSNRSKRNKRNLPVSSKPHPEVVEKTSSQSEQHSGSGGAVEVQAEFHQGPLPHPQVLEQYERIHPGTAERILKQFEKQTEHRQAIELRVVEAQLERDKDEVVEIRRGQIFALIICLVAFTAATLIAILNPTTEGAVAGGSIGGVTLVGLVTAFIVGRKKPSSNKKESSEED